MSLHVVDTLKVQKALLGVGFDQEQADTLTEILAASNEQLATKADLRELEARLENKITHLENKLIRYLFIQGISIVGVLLTMLSLLGFVFPQ